MAVSKGTVTLFATKTVLFLIGAYLSLKTCVFHWFVGPIFGVVILIWRAKRFELELNPLTGGFLAASTFIYALVLWVFQILNAESNSNHALEIAVAVGTALLPLAHMAFLSASWKRIAIAIPGIYGGWYALYIFLEKTKLVDAASHAIINVVSIWQALYLFFLFFPGRRR
ncbi:MAG: hypothetical protein HYT88_01050 [Candidatus Omnitrophica bacterium]|nr:hypothetical protein [Candidatus Omnitrophota bacterium]MBI2174420.1 hypothetical protein [Candidatus Omnitrophota bacterium]MBI3010547.1 hypothetical protein [Candidatus Omnitrophota bacterium]